MKILIINYSKNGTDFRIIKLLINTVKQIKLDKKKMKKKYTNIYNYII